MFDVEALIIGGGILIIAAIVFIESGLLVGFFLPGDTLLFSAGLLAAQGLFSIELMMFVTTLAAIAGDNVGYSIGRRAGPRIFSRKDSVLFHKDHIRRAQVFYEKHGGKTVTIARFVPVVRTFAPVVAGVGKMSRKRFLFYNVVGGVGWVVSLSMLGYWLGSKIPGLSHYIEYVLIGVIFLSVSASMLHLLRDTKTRKAIFSKVSRGLKGIFLLRWRKKG